MKKRGITIVLVLLFFAGLGFLLYPAVSDYWNSFHQTRAVISYSETVANIDRDRYERLWEEAEAYNRKLAGTGMLRMLSEEEKNEYNSILDVTDSGIMSYISIPKISCTLPVCHGTAENVLQTAAGHIEGSSFPVGGESTHCVISGHRGLPSARLFTDLDKMAVGDVFMLNTLDEVLTYEVDQILVVLPTELDALQIEEGQDLVTLVTCTPYGINTHRLLVRGHRIDADSGNAVRVTSDARLIDKTIVAPIAAAPALIFLIILIWIIAGQRKKR